jgi:hypothetical protein
LSSTADKSEALMCFVSMVSVAPPELAAFTGDGDLKQMWYYKSSILVNQHVLSSPRLDYM